MKNHRKPNDHRKKAAAYGGYTVAPIQNNDNPASFFGNFSQPVQNKPITQPIPKPVYQNQEPVRMAPKNPEPNLIDLLDQPDPQPQLQPQ